jgi:HSP20 family protein
MRRQVDRLFGTLTDGSLKRTGSNVFPAINLTENMDNYYLRAELPGVKAEDLDIQVTGRNISVSGERKIHDMDTNAKYHRRERDAGKFSRIVGLPDSVNSDEVEASLINGILTVVIPKKELVTPRQISIK